MRIWDISPGYLSRQSLLGEHRELHGLHAIVSQGKDGYSRHPETLRWTRALSGLAWRHAHLAAEMTLRGYVDRTPLLRRRGRVRWPDRFVTPPADQFSLLGGKYAGMHLGRIPLPRNAQELWAHHKYSVMARDPAACRDIGRAVARTRSKEAMFDLAAELVVILREVPVEGRLLNAVEHMWGHVRRWSIPGEWSSVQQDPAPLLALTQVLARRHQEAFLMASTSLSELAVYVNTPGRARRVARVLR